MALDERQQATQQVRQVRALPKPKRVDDGPRGDRDRPGRVAPKLSAVRPGGDNLWRSWNDVEQTRREQAKRRATSTHLANPNKSLIDLFPHKKPLAVDVTPKPADIRLGDFQPQSWGELIGADKERAQIVQNVADQYNVKARLGARDAKRIAREKADRSETEKTLTPEQWAKLSPLQQAAAQAN
ncbi:MAG: hypothetical protein KAZ88_13145, partial [Acidimicrobiia bacterium]|nr:hypothetical protein [Acidimicrobiia bacterium]